ncbi:MAG: LCP family protein [Hespellia sp.]|nr:LCP family protein [Hespellia sp.]
MANRRTGRSPEGRIRQAPVRASQYSNRKTRQADRRNTSYKKSSTKRPRPGNPPRRGRRKRGGFASWSVGKKIAAILGGTLILLITAGIGIIASKMNKIDIVELDADSLSISEEIEHDETGYLNVALFGLDTRATDPSLGSRSDTIIIASLNRETKEIRMSSVFRDTMLQQDDGSYTKANAAYAFGGPTQAVAMLNKNLDLDIKYYVTVDFSALVDVIDALGGVEIDVTEEEVQYVNAYSWDVTNNTGVESPEITGPGLQTLNGVLATAYARIRYTAGGDFKRAERQRTVIEKIVEKAQSSNLRTINKIIDEVFPKIQTNFTMTEILAYAKDAMNYKIADQQGFPEENTTDTLTGIGSTVIPQTLESNVIALHKFLFGDDGYSPSSTVMSISSEITSKATSLSGGSTDYDSGSSSYYDDSYYNDDYSDYNDYDDSYDSNDYNSDYDNSDDSGDYDYDDTDDYE